MVCVRLGGTLRTAAGGETEFEIEAETVQQMLRALTAPCPVLEPVLAAGVAVAIDGRIYRDHWFRPVPEGAEVYILPRMSGG